MSASLVKKLALAALLLTLISTGFLVYRQVTWSGSSKKIGENVFSHDYEGAIRTIKILKPDTRMITLYFSSGMWRVQNFSGYPADKARVADLIKTITELKIIQNVNIKRDDFRQLNLLSPSGKNKSRAGTEVQIYNDENKNIFTMIAGKQRIHEISTGSSEPLGRFIRLPDKDFVFFTDQLLPQADLKEKDWIEKSFTDIRNIKSVQFYKKDKKEWSISKDTDDSTDYLSDPDRKTTPNKTAVERMISSLENLQFESVADKKLTDADAGLSSPDKIEIKCFSGICYTIFIGKQINDCRYVRVEILGTDGSKINSEITRWMYLVNVNRLNPLTVKTSTLFSKDNKMPDPTDFYTKPI